MPVLDKLSFIRKLTPDIPSCVIEEIALSRSIDVDKCRLDCLVYRAYVINTIKSTKPITVTEPYTFIDLCEIATFINPNEIDWTTNELVNTFEDNWSKYWSKEPSIKWISNDTKYGYPTPQIRDSISPVIAYTILNTINVLVSYDASFDDIIRSLKNIHKTRSALIKEIAADLNLCKHTTLVSILSLMKDKNYKDEKDNTLRDLGSVVDRMKSPSYLQSAFIPFSKEEAVVASLLHFKTDVTMSNNPILEYRNLVNKKPKHDVNMSELEKVDINMFSINHQFNPNLPVNAYDKRALSSMANKACIKSIDSNLPESNYHSALTIEFNIERFHYGILPWIKRFKTMIDEEDIKIYDKPMVSYGCTKSGYNPYTTKELTDMFRANKNFRMGDRDDVDKLFSTNAINSLKNLCLAHRTRHESWGKLFKIISEIQKEQQDIEIHKVTLLSKYESLDKIGKKSMKDLLYYILYAGLRMRGWDGESPEWPVEVVGIVPDTDEQAILSGEYVGRILEEAENMGELGSFILQLPLLQTFNGTLVMITDSTQGLTIYDRIKMVATNVNGHACVRTSSGFFVTSGMYYLMVLGVVFKYDIFKVRTIL